MESLGPITFAVLVIASVAVCGLAIGSVRIRGIGLGPAGILFSGLVFGNLGASIEPQIASFAKEFGLILFVYTIGLHLGPGIIQLWKQQGLRLNAQAISIVMQGLLLTIAISSLLGLPSVTAAGLFSGATTNTPSLGAAAQAAVMSGGEGTSAELESLTAAYAVAYPGGIVGIIVSMLLLRRLFGIDVEQEAQSLRDIEAANRIAIERAVIQFDNTHLAGIPFDQIPGVEETGVRLSRVRRAGEEMVHPATQETKLCVNDIVQVVGTRKELERFTPLIGVASEIDLMHTRGDAAFRRIFVTESKALHKPLRQLALDHVYNVTITRITRSGLQITPRGSSRLHFGDVVQVVGDEESLERVTKVLGNSRKSLDETRYSPLMMGVLLGVLLGMIPFYFPGVPFPVRLGLAGGPLIAAIGFSLIGNIGSFVFYIPQSANLALRELGIILFLACAGLGAGPAFFSVAMSVAGLKWMAAGLLITMIPLLTTGVAAKLLLKQNYLITCGVIAGSMTDPPALAFANSLSDSDASSTAYAAVYPLTMILRIVAAQSIVFFCA